MKTWTLIMLGLVLVACGERPLSGPNSEFRVAENMLAVMTVVKAAQDVGNRYQATGDTRECN